MLNFTCRCIQCGRAIPLDESPGRPCATCGPIDGTTAVEYDLASARLDPAHPFDHRLPGLFRYAAILPVDPPGERLPVRVGDTPLYEAPRLASRLGIAKVLVKDDGRNPSASSKDRASAMAVAHALRLGRPVIAAASTGNAASSLALLAAAAGLRAVLFVPVTAPRPKLAQMLLAGAAVVRVHGTYDQAFDLCAAACDRFGWYSRNTATNPLLAEGKKTAALEIAEGCRWDPPDVVAVGVGDGCVAAALHKGFRELHALGLIRRLPRLIGVQAAGCAPLAHAFQTRGRPAPVLEPRTYADSIAVGVPRDQKKVLTAVAESGGEIVAVPDDLIREAQRLLARESGVFAEPAGAAGLAGLLHLSRARRLPEQTRAAVLVTGHALKDTEAALSAAPEAPMDIPASEDALDSVAARVESAAFPGGTR